MKTDLRTFDEIGPGDVVIIPPNTPHWFSEITSDQIVYLVVRVDPTKCYLPAMARSSLERRHPSI